MCLISLNDFPRLAGLLSEIARIMRAVRYAAACAIRPTTTIAYLYYFRGEYSRAIEMLFATRRACEVTGDA